MASSGLPPAVRLLRASEFDAVFANNQFRVSDRHFLVLARFNTLGLPWPGSRMGMVVAKKAIPLAVQRNRIRRLLRTSFRHLRNEMIPEHLDILILVRRGTDRLTNQDISRRLLNLWQALQKKHEPVASGAGYRQ